jgi:hypothetical protein
MKSSCSSLVVVLLLTCASLLADEDPNWERHKLDAAFRSEGVAAADVNRDGRKDVLAGDVWYAAPDWAMHEVRTPGKFVAGQGYSNSFVNFAYDVNGDGWDDLILIGFPGEPFHWYENPRKQPGHWREHLIWHSACNESPDFEDLNADGKPELILGSQPESQLGYLTLPAEGEASSKWTFHAVSAPGDPGQNGSHRYYHGVGVGDFDRDGRSDVVIPHGWYRQPDDLAEEAWEFQPWSLSPDGKSNPLPSANIYLDDLDLDGDQDAMASSAHTYGVWWFENVSEGKSPAFKYHVIDETHSQTHALEFVDMNGDGTKDLVTGKRYYAHNGADPGAEEPVMMYWYELRKQQGGPEFIAHEIVAGRDTGVGTQFQVTDMNGDNRPDIVLSNKKGVNVLLQKAQ